MSSSKQISWGVILMYIQMALNILINIFCTPIMINILGQSEYGIYNLAASIISYLNLFTLGFGASYIRFYSRYKAKNDEEGIKKLNGLFLTVFCVLGAIAAIAGAVLICNVDILFNASYSAADLKLAKTLMIFLVFNLTISFPMSVFQSYITSQEKFVFQKLMNLGKTFFSPILRIMLLYLGQGSVGMVVVTTVVTLIVDAINMFYCFGKLKFKCRFGRPDGKLLKEIFVFSFFIAINLLIDQINGQTDKLILGKMITAGAVAIYAVADQIKSMYISLSSSIASVFAPTVHRIVNSKDNNADTQLTDLFIKIGRVQFFILMLILTGFIFFGKYFINIWVGNGYEIVYYLVIILMTPSTVPLIQNVGIEIQRAKNKHQFRSVAYLLVALMNLIISIILCRHIGIIGVALGTCIADIIGTIIIMNIYYHKKIGINIIKFWKSILRASLGLVIPVIAGILIIKFIAFSNIFIYLSFIIIYTTLYFVSVYYLGMNEEEKMFVKKVFGKINRLLLKCLVVLLRPFFKILSKNPEDRVVFICFDGTQYSDNIRSISEYLHNCDSGIKQVFLFRNVKKFKHIVPRYIKCVNKNILTTYYYLCSSKVVVDNDSLAYANTKDVPKTNKQLIIETWHGDRGFKKCFKCANNEKFKYRFSCEAGKIDYFVSGSTFMEKTAEEMFGFKGDFIKVGSPRNDVLFNIDNKQYIALRKRLGLDGDEKILLYAPTYRSYQHKPKEELDFDRLINALEKKTKQKWIVVYRSHHRSSFFANSEKCIDGRVLFSDMAELLPYVDMLITDYSSCAGDFLITGKPVILYLEDYNEFEKSDKGFFFDIKTSPYLSAVNNDELINIIKSHEGKDYKNNCKEVLDFYGNYETGQACATVCDIIIEFLNSENKKF